VLLNKDRDKPKRSAFKRPTIHILNVTCNDKIKPKQGTTRIDVSNFDICRILIKTQKK